ncbi:GUN4 domain-containing protein [Gloeothece verrucosa]|uniref:GUN4 domain protein n=1 Tax=Gloeothece verrucosa (strain PCC 7822) TaxID=497965 RepID=E0UGA7_GLOV7|nr:GUN4 domain-containing protein [Gloeothece verrucosa]ADN16726.1 GUN4 domain protein [Gloeothece verrucosa PCC 7822]
MTDQTTLSVQDSSDNVSSIVGQFKLESEKNQLQLIPQLASSGEAGLNVLIEFLKTHQSNAVNGEFSSSSNGASASLALVVGKAYQVVYQANRPSTQEFCQTFFPTGVIPLKSERNIDYQTLQQCLARADFQEADNLTRSLLCELAGEAAIQRKWLYFTEVEQFPSTDLNTLNALWWIHSEGKFGFSVQRRIWQSVGKDFAKLWPKIGWKNGNNWTQYPDEFIWDLSAPQGHLPLLNQLRGVRVTASLFSHPVWSEFNW